MQKARDTYRQKVYRAERIAFAGTSGYPPRYGRRIEKVPDIQAYIDKLVASAWFRRRWGRTGYRAIRIHPGKRHTRATGDPWTGIIQLPIWARSEAVILHELAHVLCPTEAPWHGWEFLQIQLELIDHQLGKMAADVYKHELTLQGAKWRQPRGKKASFREHMEYFVGRAA
jgi:putative metallohydrolase (TIGR04338 family)